MKKFTLFIALIFTGFLLEAHEDNGSGVTENTNLKNETALPVKHSIFSITESIFPKDERRMTSVHFYSKDNETGFLIIHRKKGTIIHQNVPKGIWGAMKDAKSTSGYYNFYVKNKYALAK